jgi:hypothetical protein
VSWRFSVNPEFFLATWTFSGSDPADLGRDSENEARNQLESGGSDGSLQRPEELLATLIAPTTSAFSKNLGGVSMASAARTSLPNAEFSA